MEKEKEVWRAVVGYEGIYSVSNLGRVYSRPRKILDNTSIYRKIKGRILKQSFDKDGYVIVSLSLNSNSLPKKVHRLVANSFVSNPFNKEEVNHKDLDKQNNYKDNLEWVTKLENITHAYKNNAHNTRIKLSSKPVIVFKDNKEVNKFPSIAATSRGLDIPSSTISDYLKQNRVLYGRAKGYHFQYQ